MSTWTCLKCDKHYIKGGWGKLKHRFECPMPGSPIFVAEWAANPRKLPQCENCCHFCGVEVTFAKGLGIYVRESKRDAMKEHLESCEVFHGWMKDNDKEGKVAEGGLLHSIGPSINLAIALAPIPGFTETL